jgi:hypothetical protein
MAASSGVIDRFIVFASRPLEHNASTGDLAMVRRVVFTLLALMVNGPGPAELGFVTTPAGRHCFSDAEAGHLPLTVGTEEA